MALTKWRRKVKKYQLSQSSFGMIEAKKRPEIDQFAPERIHTLQLPLTPDHNGPEAEDIHVHRVEFQGGGNPKI
jgi:hypothetical protein